ncbi:Site-specific recombinase XerD [Marinobacter sp. DSM 26671]|uniref:site-specific integrase n=1 Tax=Marinobacter sp. DSM 26671 TaxID=1761793 RepID=UPI0008E454C6|nr:site-specific integrase [Marinobacter sp. DSM 26671]SFE16009.1 Site-specific recombinase XerD [Marinobacter sp. DSM 26671]
MKTKITVAVAREFVCAENAGKRLWDTEVSGLHLRAMAGGASWYLQYRTATDHKKRTLKLGRFPSMTVAEARKRAGMEAAKVKLGRDPQAEREAAKRANQREREETVRAYLEGPYAVYLDRRKGGKTTKGLITNHFPLWLDKPMSSLRPEDLARWQSEQEQAGKSWGTIKRAWDAMRAMLNYAASPKRMFLAKNPLAGCTLEPPALNEEQLASAGAERRFLSDEEVAQLFTGLVLYQEERRAERRRSRAHGKKHLPDLDQLEYVDHVEPWILTMFYTGFRPGDLFGLRWEHVNLNFKTIRKIVEKIAHYPEHSRPKEFPLSDAAVDVLARWSQQEGKPTQGYVFQSKRSESGRMDSHAMQKPWKQIKRLAGLPESLHLYTLRHHFASSLVMAGVDLLTVSQLMAHADIKTTIEHYGHLKPGKARDVVNLFALEQTPSNGEERRYGN